MHRFAWPLVVVALVGGLAVGYVVKGEQTKTVTVVQVQTVAPPPPATHELTATVEAKDGSCLPDSSDLQHIFVLRRPSNGISSGDVVAVATSRAMDAESCNLVLTFKVSPNLGFFEVSDESGGGSWGPFDSHALASRGWALSLLES